MEYTSKKFEVGSNMIRAIDVQCGDIIEMKRHKFFYVMYIDKFFISDEVGDLYDDHTKEDEILPEHTICTFYAECVNNMPDVTGIPGNAMFVVYRQVKGV